jgi:hypothetical protein
MRRAVSTPWFALCLRQCAYTNNGPSAFIYSGEDFESFRVMEVVMDSTELERQSLSRHRMTQMLAPHVTGMFVSVCEVCTCVRVCVCTSVCVCV